MTIQQFIEKAIEGGWKEPSVSADLREAFEDSNTGWTGYMHIRNYQIFLDPEAWKAVGKAERWEGVAYWRSLEAGSMTPAEFYLHNMIEALFEGDTIERYLETL